LFKYTVVCVGKTTLLDTKYEFFYMLKFSKTMSTQVQSGASLTPNAVLNWRATTEKYA